MFVNHWFYFFCLSVLTGWAIGQNVIIVHISGELVRLIDNCTVGHDDTCPTGNCCTKKVLTYSSTYIGDKPVYQLECQPLRQTGEFCYFDTPEQFCPCATRCHTNGFYGSCV